MVGIAAASIAEVDDTVTMPQWRVLVLVDTSGPLNLGTVATSLGVNPSNASRICDRLIRADLLDRRESPNDRRITVLSLTVAGRRLVNQVTKHRRAAVTQVLQNMVAAHRELLRTSLDRFATAAGEPGPNDNARLIRQDSAL